MAESNSIVHIYVGKVAPGGTEMVFELRTMHFFSNQSLYGCVFVNGRILEIKEYNVEDSYVRGVVNLGDDRQIVAYAGVVKGAQRIDPRNHAALWNAFVRSQHKPFKAGLDALPKWYVRNPIRDRKSRSSRRPSPPVRTSDALALIAADPKASQADRWNASQTLMSMARYMPIDVWRANRETLFGALEAEREKLPDGVIWTLIKWGCADRVRELLGDKLRGHPMEIPVLERIAQRDYAVARLLAIRDAAPPISTDNIALSKRWHVAEALIRQRDKRGIDIKLECLKAQGLKVRDPIVFRSSQRFIFTRLSQVLGRSFGYGSSAAGQAQLDQAIARMMDWWQANRRTWTFSEQGLRLVFPKEPIIPAACEPAAPAGEGRSRQ